MRIIKIRKETINIFLVWFVVLITGSANAVTISNATLTLMMLFTVFIFFKRKLKVDSFFLIVSAVYFLLYIIHVLKFGYIDLREVREFIKVIYAYAFIKVVGDRFFQIYVDTIYVLALISLPLYALQLFDYNTMKSVIGVIEHNISFLDYRDGWYENIFVFTLNDNGMYRNSGFAWEPKGFGTFLTLAFFIQLILNNFKFFDKKNMIYLIAIGTTLSTATYSIFLLGVIPFYLYNRGASFKIISSFLIIPAVLVAFTQLEFMSDKISNEYETRYKYVAFITDTTYEGKTRSLGRFGSLIVDYRDLIKEPLVGYGLFSEERTMYSVAGVKLIRVNGFSDFLAKFGLLGMFFLIFYYLSSFKKLSLKFNFKGSFIIPISILMTSLGSAILLSPLYLGFIFYGSIRTKES